MSEPTIICDGCGAQVYAKKSYQIYVDHEFIVVCGNCYDDWEKPNEIEDTPCLEDEGYTTRGDY